MSKWNALFAILALALLVGCPKFPDWETVKAGPIEVETRLYPEPTVGVKVKLCPVIGQWKRTNVICPEPEPET